MGEIAGAGLLLGVEGACAGKLGRCWELGDLMVEPWKEWGPPPVVARPFMLPVLGTVPMRFVRKAHLARMLFHNQRKSLTQITQMKQIQKDRKHGSEVNVNHAVFA